MTYIVPPTLYNSLQYVHCTSYCYTVYIIDYDMITYIIQYYKVYCTYTPIVDISKYTLQIIEVNVIGYNAMYTYISIIYLQQYTVVYTTISYTNIAQNTLYIQ